MGKPIKPRSAEAATEKLPDTVVECHELIGDLKLSLSVVMQSQQDLLRRLAELEERLKLDSRNSSKPPSSDGPGSGSGRGKPSTGLKRGGQPGHKGHSRAAVPEAELDHIVNCPPPDRCGCGGALITRGQPYCHQVFELPKIKPVVTEYRVYGGVCLDCGQYHRTSLPPGVPSGQLGPRALALIGTLSAQCQVTQNKLPALLADVFGIRFSLGCISAAHGKVADALEPATTELHQALMRAPVIHMDETSHQSHSHLMWNWTVATSWGASFHIEPSRGKIVAKGLLGEAFMGVLVTDRYAAYQWVDASKRQVCWSHLLRDFRRISQRDGLAGVLGCRLLVLAYLVFRYQHRQAEGKNVNYTRLQQRFKRILLQAAEQTSCGRTAKTCRNLLNLWPALWQFTTDPAVPSTNNLAERALRGVVLHRKISYVTRSGRGMRFVERAYGAAYTCRQQGKSMFDFLCGTLHGFLSNTTLPSLVPAQVGVG